MNFRKAASLIADQSHKAEYDYFNSLKEKAKNIVDCAECYYGKTLLIIKKNGDTLKLNWNGCKQRFNCEYQHNNRIQNFEYNKYDLIDMLQYDLYNNDEWKLF